ncbi:MAG TPA: serine/threonine-protein kinase [Labilithrix sp.]|nr:serine/threonine-protein kinase [Labilithrix sp.]
MTPLHPGYQVADGLMLVRHLGQGGMGTVWIAYHGKLGIEVVVKFLSESLVSDTEALARFKREAGSMVQVKSPHVVQTLDHGITATGNPYIVMELLEGEDLASTLRARGKLSPGEVMHIVDGVASALAKAHERGIVHRDIKPANVFLCAATPRPFVKVVDFGISKRVGDLTLTATNAFIGTPSYMSPEQISGAGVDARTDTWALGVLAYLALTGSPPFQGDSLATLVYAVTNTSPAKPSAVDPSLPPAVDAWATRALARDPGRRFSSALELADALANALGESVRARPMTVPPPAPRLVAAPKGASNTQTFAGTGATVLDAAGTTPTPPIRRSTWWTAGVAATAIAAALIAFQLTHRGHEVASAPPASAVAFGSTPVADPLPPPPPATASASTGAAPLGSATPSIAPSSSVSRSHPPPSPTVRRGRPAHASGHDDDVGF